MIRLASFRPRFFDNNGDQGNITVIAAHLRSQGLVFEINEDITGSDFALVGDCSIAVLDEFRDELLALVPVLKLRLTAGLPTLLVGRSYEFLAEHLGIDLISGARESNFVSVQVLGHQVIGYHNSPVTEPRVFVSGAFIATTLFGPLLAKNPSLLELTLRSLGAETSNGFYLECLDLAEKVRSATTF